jgi:acyl-CoA thioester hydrolase
VLIVKTWVHDFRRVRSQRAYEFRLAENNELLAQAFTDWIFVDTESERPTAVPNEMILAFRPEELPAQAPRREKFPQPPTAPVQVFNMQRPVFWHDIDEAGHLNNAAYLTFLEDCNIQVAAHFGWPPARFQENEFGIFAAHYQIEYLQPAFLNDTLELTSYLSDVAETTAVRHYLFKRISDNIPLARAKLQWHCRAYPSQKIVPIPPQLLVDFKPNLA